MNLTQYFKTQTDYIDQALNRILYPKNEYPTVIHDAMRYSVFSGGKRIRPILTVACAQACGVSRAQILPYACAVEMVHTYSLIHDDLPCMDNDDLRRGKPTCHRQFSEANAVLAGCGLLTQAFEVISVQKDVKASRRVLQVLAQAIGTHGMIGGQVVDKQYEERVPDEATLNYITIHKTGKLFAASCQIGAIVAGSSQRVEKAILRYGEYLGFAFQMVDDIMDNDGYVRVMNRDEAFQKAEHFIKRAQKEVRILGSKSRWLNEIAQFVLTRNK